MLWSQSPPRSMYGNRSYHMVTEADILTAINGLLWALSCHHNLDSCIALQIYPPRLDTDHHDLILHAAVHF